MKARNWPMSWNCILILYRIWNACLRPTNKEIYAACLNVYMFSLHLHLDYMHWHRFFNFMLLFYLSTLFLSLSLSLSLLSLPLSHSLSLSHTLSPSLSVSLSLSSSHISKTISCQNNNTLYFRLAMCVLYLHCSLFNYCIIRWFSSLSKLPNTITSLFKQRTYITQKKYVKHNI